MEFSPQIRNRECRTIVDVLAYRATVTPDATAFVFLGDGENPTHDLSFGQLSTEARALACQLLRRCRPGDRALLLYPSCLEFITAFFGCLWAGVIPVAMYPTDAGIHNARRILGRMRRIVEDAAPSVALTTSSIRDALIASEASVDELMGLQWFDSDRLAARGETDGLEAPGEEQVAFLQYTSGSTTEPRGVLITHRNLMMNERMVFLGGENRPGDMSVSWLPVSHDMGLVAAMLQALYSGMGCVLLSPVHFLKRPLRWLKAISDYSASYSGAPNFAYDLCARKLGAEEVQGLDLSSWELAFTSSEPIHAATIDRFCEAFEPCGFRRHAFYPAYGLAEATVFVTGGRRGVEPGVKEFSRHGLQLGRAQAPEERNGDRTRLVSSGSVFLDEQVAIVDPVHKRRIPELEIGEIWVRGKNVSPGYWRAEEKTAATFGATIVDEGSARWLRTGDLGFVEDGELFVTGRLKDIIIIAGRNLYPQDVEQSIEQAHPALRPGCSAAFLHLDGEVETVVAVAEVKLPNEPSSLEGLAEVWDAAVTAVARAHEIRLHDLWLLPPGTIPKTSSGKVRRSRCREHYESGALEGASFTSKSASQSAPSTPQAEQ